MLCAEKVAILPKKSAQDANSQFCRRTNRVLVNILKSTSANMIIQVILQGIYEYAKVYLIDCQSKI